MALKVLDGPSGIKFTRTCTGPAGLTYGLGVKQGATPRSLVAVTGAGQKPIGLIQDSDVNGSGVYGVTVLGEEIGISGAAFGLDVELMLDANGNLVPSAAQGDYVLCRSITAATAANQEVVVFVDPYIR